jgi:hypothetical protein
MTPTSIPVSSHKTDKKKKKQDNMRTRKNDTNKRSTTNSEKRVIITEDFIQNKKKKLSSAETCSSTKDSNDINQQEIAVEKKNLIVTSEKDSGTSYSENEMESVESGEIDDEKNVQLEQKLESETVLAKKMENTTTMSDSETSSNVIDKKKQIIDDKQKLNSDSVYKNKSEKATTMSDSESSSNVIGKKKQSYSLFPIRIKSSLLWYVRNELFQSIKIVGDEHLETDGVILKNALAKVEYDSDSKTQNYHAYVHEVRRLIKQTMCSRRGYVKRKIGVLLRGKQFHSIIIF